MPPQTIHSALRSGSLASTNGVDKTKLRQSSEERYNLVRNPRCDAYLRLRPSFTVNCDVAGAQFMRFGKI